MNTTEIATGQNHLVEVVAIEKSDFENLPADRYFFYWNEEVAFEILELTIKARTIYLG